MNQEAVPPPVIGPDESALEGLREVLKDHELPVAYQRLLTSFCGPWYVMAEAILEDVDAQSDTWKRIIWFSRILCAAIPTSLQRQKSDAVDEVLDSFTKWLHSSSQAAGIQDMVLSTADYVCAQLREQIAMDVGRADCAEEPCVAQELTGAFDDQLIQQKPVNCIAEQQAADDPEPQEIASGLIEQEFTVDPVKEEPVEDSSLEEIEGSPLQEINDSSLQQHFTPKDERTNSMETQNLTEALTEAADIRSNVSDLAVGERSTVPGTKQVAEKSATGLLPMGLWIGFRDEDMPTMAKLTIYDRANERYMFANEQGILIREISETELLDLVQNDLVSIVDFRKVSIKPVAQNEHSAEAGRAV